MKKWLIIAAFALVMTMPSLAISQEMDAVCGLDAAKSETKFYVLLEGKKIPTAALRCTYLWIFVKNKYSWLDRDNLPRIEARDFLSGEMFTVDLETPHFVSGADVVPKGSMPPYLLGFSTLERANEFLRTHFKPGARLINFETGTHEVIAQLREEGILPPAPKAAEEAAEKQVEYELKKGKEMKRK